MSELVVESRQVELADGSRVSAEIARPQEHRPGAGTMIVLGHGAGTNMHYPQLTAVQRGLATRGFASVKFNFAYTEQKKKAPDRMPALEDCYRRVVEAMRTELAPARVILGGRSMGGRVASHLAAQGLACDGLVFFGYPLHPAGRPEQLRTAHLPKIAAPMLFLVGTRDTLSDLGLLRAAVAPLQVPITLHVIEGADHSFKVLKSVPRDRDIVDELVDVAARWINDL